MNYNYVTVAILSVVAFSGCDQQSSREPVAGRRVIEIAEGDTYVIMTKTSGLPQFEISIGDDYFGIAQLSEDGPGPPPIMIQRKEGILSITRSVIADGAEIITTDDDGDGLADFRMTVPERRDASNPPRIDDISHSFIQRPPNGDAAEQGAAANP